MTTPNDIVLRLADLSRSLGVAVEELAKLDESYVRAKSRHEFEYAKNYMSLDGTVEERKQATILTVKDYRLDMDIAESRVRAQKELIRLLQTRIDIGRTMSATVRSEVALAGYAPS
jgi:hypothetical protein